MTDTLTPGMRVRDRLTGTTGTIVRGITDYGPIIHFDGASNATVWVWATTALIPVTG